MTRLGGQLVAETNDPQLLVKPQKALEPGWYQIEIDIESDGYLRPQVYFDFGSGFSELHSARLQRARKNGRFVVCVKFPKSVLLLRLDPLDQPGKFVLATFRATRLGSIGIAARLGYYGVQRFFEGPSDFFHRMPDYLRTLEQPVLVRLGDPRQSSRRLSSSRYHRWIEKYDFDMERDGPRFVERLDGLANAPLISIVMPVYNTRLRFLRQAIESVRSQLYPNWQLCIADDCSTRVGVRRLLRAYARLDSRIKVVFRRSNGHISHATNSALELADGNWIGFLDHDDMLRPHALAEVVMEIDRHPQAQIIYSDEDKISGRNYRYEPYFKPNFSPELFRSQNYLNHFSVHRAENIRAVAGMRPGFEGSQDYDLNLRIIERIGFDKIRHIPKVLYHWRATSGSTALAAGEKSYAYDAGFRALQEHVVRCGLPATVGNVEGTPFYRLRFTVPEPQPRVSLIIPTRDKVDLLRPCIESIRSKTAYRNYEIIVIDNGSIEPQTLQYFSLLQAQSIARVLKYDRPFNFSALNNFGVDHASGEIVGLINNDIEVISPDWMGEMVSWAAQPKVGCVGAKLYYANDTIQHAGVILGVGGVANHAHLDFPRPAAGYFGRAVVVNNYSAVTGACLLVRKAVYLQVDGLNERDLAVSFNDVDFCLRVQQAGYRNVWTPYAEMYHFESASRGRDDTPAKRERFEQEVSYMQHTWADALSRDPYYSVHLSNRFTDFSLAE